MATEDRQVPIAIAASPLKDSVVYVEFDSKNHLIPGYQGLSETAPEAGTEEVSYRNGTLSFAGDETPGSIEVSFIHQPGTAATKYLLDAVAAKSNIKLIFRTKGRLLYTPPATHTIEVGTHSNNYGEILLKNTGGATQNWKVGENIWEGAVWYNTDDHTATGGIVVVDQVIREWDDDDEKDPFLDPSNDPYTANATHAYSKHTALASSAGWTLFTPFYSWTLSGQALSYAKAQDGATPIATLRVQGPDTWPQEVIIHHNDLYLPAATN